MEKKITVDYDKIFDELSRKGISQAYVSEKLGMHENTYSLKKLGKVSRELKGTQLAIVCDILGSPMDMFVTKKN